MRNGAKNLLLEADHRVDRHHVQIAVADRDTGVQRVNDLAVAGVDSDVGRAAVVGNDVTRLNVAQSDLLAGGSLSLGGTRDGLASLSVNPGGEAGAVEGVRAGSAVNVRGADLGLRDGNDALTNGRLRSCLLYTSPSPRD